MSWAGAVLVSAALGAHAPSGSEPAVVLHERILAAREAGEPHRVLELLSDLERRHPDFYAANSYAYLSGVVAAGLGETARAEQALALLAGQAGPLRDRATLRLARLLERHAPARALSALRLLRDFETRFPGSAVASDARLLEVAVLARTGARAEAARARQRLPKRLQRQAQLKLFEIAVERGSGGRELALQLLAGSTKDAAASAASRYLFQSGTRGLSIVQRFDLANALVTSRSFPAAIVVLEGLVAQLEPGGQRAEALFSLGRAAMKAGDDVLARSAFERVAAMRGGYADRGRYQLGRLALGCGDEERALEEFSAIVVEAPARSSVAGQALVKLARIYSGRRDVGGARRAAEELRARYGASSTLTAQAAIDATGALLTAGRYEEALRELSLVEPADADLRRELAYWRGVALMALGRSAEAREELRDVGAGRDLLAGLARARLGATGEAQLTHRDTELVAARAELAAGDAAGAARRLEKLVGITPATSPERDAALELLQAAYRELPTHRAVFELEALRPRTARRGEEPGRGHAAAAAELQYLGLYAEAADELARATPRPTGLSRPYQVADLAARGGDLKTSLRYAELLAMRLPKGFVRECLPREILQLLYPLPYEEVVLAASKAPALDADLVHAVMREESRFDPDAYSPAGAHGLMQFIPETARRVGATIGIEELSDQAVYEPAVAVRLGTAYLSELLLLFGGQKWAAVAAYNAGEEAAFQWLSRTGHGELDEFLREIEYSETRAYVDRVLTSLAGYRVRRGAP